MKKKDEIQTNQKNIALNKKNLPNKINKNKNQKNAIKKSVRKRMRENLKSQAGKNNSSLQNSFSKNDINLKINKNDVNLRLNSNKINFDDIKITKTINFDDIKKLNISETNHKNNNKFSDFTDNSKEKNTETKQKQKQNFKNNENLNNKNNDLDKTSIEDIKTPSINEFKADLKNLKLSEEKASLEFDKKFLERKIRKNYALKFKEKEQTIDENGDLKIKNKLIVPKLEQKDFKYNDSLPRKTFYRTDDLIRGKIHNEINKTEDDNTTVKALHTSEKFIERKLINFKRNSNYRNIKKHSKLENKISKIETKQTLNSLKVQFKDDKQAYKQAIKEKIKKRNQKNRYKKMMMKNINKAKFIKSIQNTISNVLAFKSNPLTYLLSFKAILIGIILFFIMIFLTLVITIFSSFTNGAGNIYEVQKAELYYRELEATNEYNTGNRINHDPIDLASLLTVMFGEFEFNEEMENFLKDEVFSKQLQGKSLEQIISDFLTMEEYDYYLQLYEIKCGFIRYGSPFEIEYESKITSYIGYRINPTSAETKLQLHKGLDIGMAGGTPILAISDGVVTRANFSNSYGNIVEILHDDGYTSKYAHQQKLNVKQGQRVKQGDIIGFVGTTGDSTGNHLHLELYDELGEFMNPIYFIARDNERSDNDSN